MNINTMEFKTNIGIIQITEEDGKIIRLSLLKDTADTAAFVDGMGEETPVLNKARKEILEFFDGKRKYFDLPLNPKGTEFQKNVWNALLQIPYGEVKSYKDIACMIGNPKGCRAVGMANNRNPIPIIIPCHRVIGSNGSLVGYAYGLDIKEKLLALES